MTLTIRLTPPQARALAARAARAGQELPAYVEGLLARAAADDGPVVAPDADAWEQAADELARLLDRAPVLPDEAFERAALYGARG